MVVVKITAYMIFNVLCVGSREGLALCDRTWNRKQLPVIDLHTGCPGIHRNDGVYNITPLHE